MIEALILTFGAVLFALGVALGANLLYKTATRLFDTIDRWLPVLLEAGAFQRWNPPALPEPELLHTVGGTAVPVSDLAEDLAEKAYPFDEWARTSAVDRLLEEFYDNGNDWDNAVLKVLGDDYVSN